MTAGDHPANNDPRVYFAAERTLLAWIRTGLALMGFGFVVARFGLFLQQLTLLQKVPVPATGASRWFGTGLVMSGVVVTVGAMAIHARTVQRLRRGEPYEGELTWLGLATAGLLAAGGIALCVYLLTFPA
jgi:putative membrane protein